MSEFYRLLKAYGVQRIAAITGATLGVTLALALIVSRLGAPSFGILYADLDLREGQQIVAQLDSSNVPYRLQERAGRVSIMAPRDRIAALKLNLAADGIMARSGVGYELFDKAEAFGQTSFQQNINRVRALEGELARTIMSIDGVRAARVHLVLAERELFARERRAATASIVIDAPRGLDPRSVRAVVNLTASAVPELSPGAVTVLDASGALLTSPASDMNMIGDERSAATEARLRRTVEDIVGGIVGPANVRVQVAAELDFSRITESAQIIDPDSQSVLSAVTIEESNNARDPAIGRGVSVANALPGTAPTDSNAIAASTSASRRTEETTNYEFTRTTRSEVHESGRLKRLSVAVAINAGAAPRTEEELSRITALVRSAVGYTPSRGDQLSVVEAPFANIDAGSAATSPAPMQASVFSINGAARFAEIAALGAIGMALIYFVLRPLLKPAPTSTPIEKAATSPLVLTRETEQQVDFAQLEGRVKASSLRRVADVVKGHTEESAGILKTWIREGA